MSLPVRSTTSAVSTHSSHSRHPVQLHSIADKCNYSPYCRSRGLATRTRSTLSLLASVFILASAMVVPAVAVPAADGAAVAARHLEDPQSLSLMELPPPAGIAVIAAAVAAAFARVAGSGAVPSPIAARRAVLLSRAAMALAVFAVVLLVSGRIAAASALGALSALRFVQYFAAGGICAFLTHAACTPIDVVKTRMQTTQGKYVGLMDGTRKIIAEEGPAALLKGLGATAGGYFLHGAFKFSFYEVFKVLLTPTPEAALKPPMLIAALAGFGAECIACILLCPMEAVRIRSVADYSFPSGVLPGLRFIYRTEGLQGLYKGLPAMMLKQVPYTVGQFVSYEFFVVAVRTAVAAALMDPVALRATSTVGFISTVAGLLAGVAAAIISHPGDTILSRVNQEQGDGGDAFSHISRVVRAAGVRGLFSGLSVRILQVACMIGGQFLIYDTIKFYCGIRTASSMAQVAVQQAVAAGVGAAVSNPAALLKHMEGAGNTEFNMSSAVRSL